ncbi:ATP-binding domain-containing protein [Sphingopyxis sp. GC21]|uniref:ATP-binding domain-containing protein n=1 Tax=Sphingopyxis sp. GC21 TaxID=2933562 RepID=UPI0021E486B7|nr:ATP-binding domain-containing protein [Sphingopyxis sp. GC21]
MSDNTVAAALRSAASLVVIEAPGGCGKTHQGSHYASDAAAASERRVLILTHTHAACDVFADRTRGSHSTVEIRTIDSLIGQIATAYHPALGLPADVALWSRTNRDGYQKVAAKVAHLLNKKPMIAASLARRYPLIICDEHQDATVPQEQIILALYKAGAHLRIFADPMQRIFGNRQAVIDAEIKRWNDLKEQAEAFEELDTPHRWANTNPALGNWILAARATLRDGGQIDLRGGLPNGLHILRADNVARARGQYQLTNQQRAPLTQRMQPLNSVLVVAAHNSTVSSLRAFFNRSIPIWEGHTRDALDGLCNGVRAHNGNAVEMGKLAVGFVSEVAIGFTASGYSRQLLEDIAQGCTKARTRKPATIQALGRIILDEPNHRGISRFLTALRKLTKEDAAFASIKIDHSREFNDAVHLGRFDDADEGLAEIARRRAHARAPMPTKAVSTIHKAKGLEFPHVVMAACDQLHFNDSQAARAKLYVGLSRATESLTLLVSHTNPTPLLLV